ncbi:mitochondrial assembly of ribosomal large subunit protein 1 [Syngnathoides biaculeatus]|uniref:mitochondrial assembly of ribosomal large subunit protein 1 n=1 Tax=Syngnathoides biaculeatus TaxID=300417 RepID=UPI002ADDCDD8|nr:mitochondrial assembly of ribosomal large subunit protein 1 [Syngnathoides biaculeatus]
MPLFKRIYPLLCTSRALVENSLVFTRLCSVKVPCRNGLSPAHSWNSHLTRCVHHVRHQSACHFYAKRYFSQMDIGGSHLPTTPGLIQDESREMEGDANDKRHPRERPVETFNLDVLVALLRQENAVDICVIKVPDHIKYTEHFIVVSGVSPRHLRAMALYAVKVYKFMKNEENAHVKIEGKTADDWTCIDFGSIVVHFMLPETREAYELEKLWTLRSYDEQLQRIPDEKLPEDFVYDLEITK